MQTMTITSFKAHALRKIAQVAERREAITITRRGRPIAQVVPWSREKTSKTAPGRLRHLLVRDEDVVSPVLTNKEWEACR